MYFYKQIKDEKTVAYQSSMLHIYADDLTEISEDEYNATMPSNETEPIENEITDEPSYEDLQMRVSELETENASLLFEKLTGEVFTDV